MNSRKKEKIYKKLRKTQRSRKYHKRSYNRKKNKKSKRNIKKTRKRNNTKNMRGGADCSQATETYEKQSFPLLERVENRTWFGFNSSLYWLQDKNYELELTGGYYSIRFSNFENLLKALKSIRLLQRDDPEIKRKYNSFMGVLNGLTLPRKIDCQGRVRFIHTLWKEVSNFAREAVDYTDLIKRILGLYGDTDSFPSE